MIMMPAHRQGKLTAGGDRLSGCAALLESRWPRFGVGQADIAAGRCLGRFAAVDEHWILEGGETGPDRSGEGEPLAQLEMIVQEVACQYPRVGAIGYVAYEQGYSCVGLDAPEFNPDPFRVPQVQFLLFENLAVVESRGKETKRPEGREYPRAQLLAMTRSSRVQPQIDHEQYVRTLRQIKEHIREGDIYQANYTQAFNIRSGRSGVEIYEALAASNPAPFAAYLRFPPLRLPRRSGATLEFSEVEIISNSPERFWRKTGSLVETRPIKGTIPRGGSAPADRSNQRKLLSSPKDRAELLMITDLERNDLGKFAQIGSINVQALRRPKAYSSVWHLESVVTARVDPSTRWDQIMRCMFPGGSITGAPKRRAMEILRDLEPVPRGVYCGAIGWVDAAGNADFSIAIRTAVKVGDMVRVYGGGGIVADSDPEAEYEESLVKIAPILDYLCR
jgi:anthranilate/para-aminobenzoate synthase component I